MEIQENNFLKYIRTSEFKRKISNFFLLGLLLDSITTILGKNIGFEETHPYHFLFKTIFLWLFIAFTTVLIDKERKVLDWLYVSFCFSFGLAWTIAGIQNIVLIVGDFL